MNRLMPKSSLRAVSVDFLLANDGLGTGEVDAAIAPPGSLPNTQAEPLYHEGGCVVLRTDHPRIGSVLSAKHFNQEEHIDVLITMGKGGTIHSIFEDLLRQQGLARNVKVAVPSFSAAAQLAAVSDRLACLPERLSQKLAENLPIRLLPLPANFPEFPLALHWHERTQADSASKHFRNVVLEALCKTSLAP
jgi:DNA-binding transcriptional LysR family regulator